MKLRPLHLGTWSSITIHCRLRELILILTDADCIATFRPVPAKASYSAAPLGCLNVSMPRIGRELLVPSFHDFWSVAAWDRTPTSPTAVGGSATESLRPVFQLRDWIFFHFHQVICKCIGLDRLINEFSLFFPNSCMSPELVFRGHAFTEGQRWRRPGCTIWKKASIFFVVKLLFHSLYHFKMFRLSSVSSFQTISQLSFHTFWMKYRYIFPLQNIVQSSH